nr:hypothetical protein [uncultured Rhodoferax sp.]
MNKLLKLKKWMTLEDAAVYLSTALSEPVKVADLLQAALDKEITLSVNVISSLYGKRATVVSKENARRTEGIPLAGFAPYEVILGMRLDNERYLDFHGAVVQSLEGLFDLPMLGGESIYLEEKFHQVSTGVEIDLTNLDGTFLQEPPSADWGEGDYFQVFQYFERTLDWNDLKWYPVGNLPDTVFLVVRTNELNRFLNKVGCRDAAIELQNRPVETKERNTLLCIIAALCREAKIPFENHSKAAGLIQGAAQQMGVSVGETTIEGHLKKIPDALATRMK